jgi:DNA-binding beta-propeller fold protein YncE
VDRRRFLGLAAAAALLGPDAVRAAPPLLAVATCDLDERLAVVDVAAGRVSRFVPCPADPRSIELVGGRDAVVCHTAPGAVSILDGRKLTLRHVLHGFTEPRYTAAHPDGRHAFVTDSGSVEVVAIEVARGRALGRVRLDDWPRHVTIAPSGRTLWVGLGTASTRVAVVDVSDPARPRHTGTIRPPFLAHDVGFAPGATDVWVTSGDVGEVAVYGRSGRLRLRLPADASPQHVSFAGTVAYVTSGDAGTLRTLSALDGRVLRTARVPIGSYNVQAGHGLVLTPSLDGGLLSVLDRHGRLLRQVHVGRSSHDVCFLS